MSGIMDDFAQDMLEQDIPMWWVLFIDHIESWIDRGEEVKYDPIVDFDEVRQVSSCAVCSQVLWGNDCEEPHYNPLTEYKHFRDNHEEVMALARLRV